MSELDRIIKGELRFFGRQGFADPAAMVNGRIPLVQYAVAEGKVIIIRDVIGSFRRLDAVPPSSMDLAGLGVWQATIDGEPAGVQFLDQPADATGQLEGFSFADVSGQAAAWQPPGKLYVEVAGPAIIGVDFVSRVGIPVLAHISEFGALLVISWKNTTRRS